MRLELAVELLKLYREVYGRACENQVLDLRHAKDGHSVQVVEECVSSTRCAAKLVRITLSAYWVPTAAQWSWLEQHPEAFQRICKAALASCSAAETICLDEAQFASLIQA